MPEGVAVGGKFRMSPFQEWALATLCAVSFPSTPMCALTHVRSSLTSLDSSLWRLRLSAISIPDRHGAPWLMALVAARAAWLSAQTVMLLLCGLWCSRATEMALISASVTVLLVPR